MIRRLCMDCHGPKGAFTFAIIYHLTIRFSSDSTTSPLAICQPIACNVRDTARMYRRTDDLLFGMAAIGKSRNPGYSFHATHATKLYFSSSPRAASLRRYIVHPPRPIHSCKKVVICTAKQSALDHAERVTPNLLNTHDICRT